MEGFGLKYEIQEIVISAAVKNGKWRFIHNVLFYFLFFFNACFYYLLLSLDQPAKDNKNNIRSILYMYILSGKKCTRR